MEEKNLAETIFKKVNRYLEEKGVLMRQGAVVDATVIKAPGSTRNKERQRDPERHFSRKGNRGIKCY